SPAKGIRKGAIVDIDDTVKSIEAAVKQAEYMVDMTIENVIVTLNSNHIRLQPCQGIVAVQSESREIDDDDVKRVIEGAKVVSLPPDREIIDVIPTQFVVDGMDDIADPRGMIGVRLEMEGSLITCSKTILHNIIKCLDRTGLTISDICIQPIGSGSIALSEDEKSLGVALIDIGGGCTDISVFDEGHLKQTAIVPIGGNNISKDLSRVLRISSEEAEKLKVDYGHAFHDTASADELLDVNIIGSDEKVIYNQKEISEIIEARIEELFQMAAKEIARMGYNEIRGGIVLTGGTMNMPGVLELANDIFYVNSRAAIPDFIGVRDPQFTAGVGAIKFTYHNAKIQGKTLSSALSHSSQPQRTKTSETRKPKKVKQAKPKTKGDNQSKVKNFLKGFFE